MSKALALAGAFFVSVVGGVLWHTSLFLYMESLWSRFRSIYDYSGWSVKNSSKIFFIKQKILPLFN
jgi:hypothetical protein